jgi:hypothetical protein
MNPRARLRILVSTMLLCSAITSEAAVVRIDFSGSNSSPGAANVFGTPVPDVTGYLIYDDATAGVPFSSTATNYSGAIKEIYFSMGAGGSSVFSGSRSGSFGSAQVQNAAGSDRLSFNNMTLTASQLVGEVPTVVNSTGDGTRTFNDAQLTFGLAGTASTISDQALLGIDPLAFTGTPRNLSVFLSYTTTGATSGFPASSFNYNFTTLSVAPVPLPAAGWLLLSGLGGVGALARRRKRTA